MLRKLCGPVLMFFLFFSFAIGTTLNAENKGIQIEEGEVEEKTITLEGVIYKDPTNLKYNIILLKFKTVDGEILDPQQVYTGKSKEDLMPYLDKNVKITADCLIITKKEGGKIIKVTHSLRKIKEIKFTNAKLKKK